VSLRALLVCPLLVAACHPTATATFDAAVGPYPLAPGEEKTVCITRRLNNPEATYIHRIRAEIFPGSHHMTIYRSTADLEVLKPFECFGFDSVLRGDRPLFIAQQERAELAFPTDESGQQVGYAIDAHQMLRLELHYINTTREELSPGGIFHLDTVTPNDAIMGADIAFWGTTDIDIPPHAAWETPVKFVPAEPGTRTFAMTTHQHSLGTRMRVWFADNAEDIRSKPVDESRTWSDPPLVRFDPPLRFGSAGKAGLAYQCNWQNPTANEVHYGEHFHDEMCFVWHYYYPGRGFDHVVQP
jgi:hypothetical protein